MDFDIFSNTFDSDNILEMADNLNITKKYSTSGSNYNTFNRQINLELYIFDLSDIYPLEPPLEYTDEQKSVNVTMLSSPDLIYGRVHNPYTCPINQLKIASSIDLLANKLLVLLKRQEYKDLIDIIELISHPKISLEDGLKCFFALHYHKFQESKDKYQNMCLEFKNICLSDKSKDLIRNNSLYDILKIQAKKIDVNNVIKAINTIKIYDDLSGHVIDKSPHHKPRF